MRSDTMSSSNDPQESTSQTMSPDRAEEPAIPRYIIDLSLPPIKRYQQLAKDFLPQVVSLSFLFDEIVPRPAFRTLAKLLLRRLFSREQTEELRGIHLVTNVGMHLLVAFNVLLDLFMGCTSAGVRVSEGNKMLHLRTLDWGMHPLRKVIVQLDYIRDGVRVASAISYVGYVGVLTGVKQSLSMSLNFRPIHNASNWLANFRLYLHHALVLFGFRPAISSILRDALLLRSDSCRDSPSLEKIVKELPSRATTAAYLIFCNGERTIVLEKDYNTAVLRSSQEFIVATNHDEAQERGSEEHQSKHTGSTSAGDLTGVLDKIAMHGVVAESNSRKRCLTKLYKGLIEDNNTMTTNSGRKDSPSRETIIAWINTYPITNALTHYASVMDPERGDIAWVKHYPNPRALWDLLIQQDHIK